MQDSVKVCHPIGIYLAGQKQQHNYTTCVQYDHKHVRVLDVKSVFDTQAYVVGTQKNRFGGSVHVVRGVL